ncbi:MAG: hypothetical protein ACP5MD_13010 [Verrucomicrobiia bacterium]
MNSTLHLMPLEPRSPAIYYPASNGNRKKKLAQENKRKSTTGWEKLPFG